MRAIRVGLVLALAVGPIVAADDPARFWDGKSKTDVVLLLGEAPKSKRGADGGERLTYWLVRLREGAHPQPGLIPIQLPGVGLVGRQLDDLDTTRTTIEPTTIDDRGRPVGGGVTYTDSTSTTWNVGKKDKDGEPKKAEGLPRDRGKDVLGRVKVVFQLDAQGRVLSWSAR